MTLLALLLLVAAVPFPAHVHAQHVDLSGQKVALGIATPSGGGYDLYGRLAARHLSRYLPGNPIIVPQNMPGAGSLIAANWLANVAPKDGTAIAIIPSATLFENLLGNASARFDARSFKWLVSLNDYTAVALAWHEAPIVTASDLISREFLVGSNAPASDTTIWPQLLNALIGAKIKLVRGYAGSTGIMLAMERGEVQGIIGDDWAGIKASKAALVQEKKIRVVLQMTQARHPDLQNVPLAAEFATSEENRRLLELFVARQRYGRPFLAPPGTPEPIVAAYRTAFAMLVNDTEFRREAEQAQLMIKASPGEEVAALVDEIYAYPKPVLDRATVLLRSIAQ
jgi:tripartite-type tricarboxylate transporter receptor subunit TctC